jgi:hypothetical protein
MVVLLVAMAFNGMAKDLYASMVTLVVAIIAYLLVRAWRGSAVRSPAA